MSADLEPLQQTTRILRFAQVILRPLVAWMLRCGITYSALSHALKLVFLEQSEKELRRRSQKCNDSSISAISGLNRKIVRQMWRDAQSLKELAESTGRPSLPARLITRWQMYIDNSAATSQDQGAGADPNNAVKTSAYPQQLPYKSSQDAPSFEALVSEVTGEVRPRSILLELERLGLVKIDMMNGKEYITIKPDGFIPTKTSDEMLQLLSGAISDHMWTGVDNIEGRNSPKLDQSVFVSGLSRESVEELDNLARQIWKRNFPRIADKATQLYERDAKENKLDYRARIGMYFHGGLNQDKGE